MEQRVSEKPCDCKGKRTCLLCEKLMSKTPRNFFEEYQKLDSFVFCRKCSKIFKGWSSISCCDDHKHSEDGIFFPGVHVTDFLTTNQSEQVAKGLDQLDWDLSQSGRRKKNFGPKVNFKKKKLSVGKFQGFPALTQCIRERLRDVPLLHDFDTIEECFLEYNAARGSHIEPHIDDCWIWGDRIVTVNCVGDTVLTLTKHVPLYPQQYNLDTMDVEKLKSFDDEIKCFNDNIVVRVPMPEKSLLVLYGPPRFRFEHSVLREDINPERFAIAYREFPAPYQKNGSKFCEAEEIYALSEKVFL